MARQNLEQEAIFALFTQWEDERLSTDEMTVRLVAMGHLEVDVWQFQKDACVKLLHGHRKRLAKRGKVKDQWLNFTETNEEGEKVHYWKKYKRTNPEELVQFLQTWTARIEQGHAIFYQYYDAIPRSKKRRVDEMFGVDNLPPRPRQLNLAGMEDD